MMSSIYVQPRQADRQQGIALIMALVFLMLLTIIGVTAMTTTSLQEKMAGNVQNKNSAFQAAESALRVGENLIDTWTPLTTPNFNANTAGYYLPAAATSAPVWNTVDWSSCPGTPQVICLPNDTIAKVQTQPAYIIEQLAQISGSGGTDSLVAGFKPPPETSGTATLYRVTGRGTGSTDNALALVQSVYRR